MLTKIRMLLPNIALSFLGIFVAFAVLEVLWLGWIAAEWYQTQMQSLLRQDYIRWPWLVFYLMYATVMFVLAVVPNREKPWFYAAIDGALLGLASYGAYNLTNYSIIEGFTLSLMLIDWCWGIFLTSISATAGWYGFKSKST